MIAAAQRWWLVGALGWLTACAAPDPLVVLPPAVERLQVQFNDNGSKFFEFTREYTARRVDGERRPVSPDVLSRRVEDVLDLTGYCREGFFELYRQPVERGLVLRGECREAANNQDRDRFSDGEVIYARQP